MGHPVKPHVEPGFWFRFDETTPRWMVTELFPELKPPLVFFRGREAAFGCVVGNRGRHRAFEAAIILDDGLFVQDGEGQHQA